jgi:hypothetical protein
MGVDYPEVDRHRTGHVSEVCLPCNIAIRAILVAMISIGFLVLVLFAGMKSAGGASVKKDFSPYWHSNRSIFNRTENNVCLSSRALIDRDHKPVAVNLPGREHCETIYYLGHSDYVYVCRYDGDFSVVFATVIDIEANDLIEVSFSWRQYCSLMFLNDRIIDDLTHIMFSV